MLPAWKRAGMKLAGWVLRFGWLYRLAAWIARRAIPALPRGLLYSRWNSWGRQRELPPMPRETFRDLHRRHHGRP